MTGRFEARAGDGEGAEAGLWMIWDTDGDRRRTDPILGRELAEEYAATLNEIEDLPPIRRWRLGLYRMGQAVQSLVDARARLGGRATASVTRHARSEPERRAAMIAIKAAFGLIRVPLDRLQQDLHDHLGYRNAAVIRTCRWWVDVARWREVEARAEVAAAAANLRRRIEYERKYPDPPI